ncbi:MAG: glycosyltransferase [Clostridia bacterium]|nr:glycosyltransferase [Clostridia bacterium]
MEGKKKLLFVMAEMYRGGAEVSLINLFKLIDINRYDIDLLVFDQAGPLMSAIPSNVNLLPRDRELRCISTSSKKEFIENISIGTFFARLAYQTTKKSSDIPYVQNQDKWNRLYRPILKPLQKEYDTAIAYMHSLPSYFVIDKVQAKRKILWVHNDYSKLLQGKDFDRVYFEKADEVVTISAQCVKELQKAFPNLDNKFKCIGNLNPAGEIKRKALEFVPEEYAGIYETKIVSIGRLTNQKGFDIAVEAARLLKNKNIPFQWFIIGTGELRQALSQQIEICNLEDRVHLLGSKQNPYPYIYNSDMVAQTSRFEGKSIVLDEAKILCKPILTTNYTSVNDQIENGVTGIIVPIDASQIAAAIEMMISKEMIRRELEERLKEIPDPTEIELEKYYACFDGKGV